MSESINELLSIQYPILQGGMGNISSPELSAAISEAGGLGTLGVGTMTPSEVEAKLVRLKDLTSQSFAVNIPIKVTPHLNELLLLIEKYKVPVVSLSAGNPAPYIGALKAKGIKVICVSSTIKQAQKAEAAGADAIVAEGYEAAGINSPHELTTFAIIPQIVAAVTVPVIAAGGIADGSGFAAALALGAAGVQMGTRFIAVKEAPFHPSYKSAIVEADETSTVVVGRSVGKIRRLLRNPYAKKLLEYEKQKLTLAEFDELTSETQHKNGALAGDFANGFMNSGQIAGLIEDVPSARELIKRMIGEAEVALQTAERVIHAKNVVKGGEK